MPGVKIVFDNIDKTIKPRHMTLNSQTTSLHYVQAMAVKDRIDYSFLSDKIDPKRECNLYDILPDADDYDSLKKRFITHISRMIVVSSRLIFWVLFQPIYHTDTALSCLQKQKW